MPRAPKRCSPSCSNPAVKNGRCKEHQPERVAWQKSEDSPDRSFLRSAEWKRQRRRVLYRDGYKCQYRISDECLDDASDVDHVIPTWYTGVDEVPDDELRSICSKCHAVKSSYEGVAAKKIKNLRKDSSGNQNSHGRLDR